MSYIDCTKLSLALRLQSRRRIPRVSRSLAKTLHEDCDHMTIEGMSQAYGLVDEGV